MKIVNKVKFHCLCQVNVIFFAIMAKTERDEWENCFICNEFMGTFKNNLTVTSSFSDKPIYQIFGKIFAGFLRTNENYLAIKF